MTAPRPDALGTVVVGAATHVVRRARPEDVPALVALLAADQVATARGESPEDLEPYRRALVAIDDDPHQLLACLVDPAGTVVGTLQLTIIPGLSRRGMSRAQIEAVRVGGTARGRGLGTGFLEWAIGWARDAGCGLVQLTTDAGRHDAHRFYRRLGFEHTHHGFKLALTPSTPVGGATVVDLVAASYAPLLALADRLDEPTGWTPTLLPGWTTRDLLFHLAGDARRALVALATPADGPADTDEVTYWTHIRPGDEQGLKAVRVMASQWPSVRGVAEYYTETARAVLVAARRADLREVVATQGHRLTVASLLGTLAVEAAIHQLDLEPVVPGPPAPAVTAEVRRVLDELLGVPAPVQDEVHWMRVATGRVAPSAADRAMLGDRVDRLPLFG